MLSQINSPSERTQPSRPIQAVYQSARTLPTLPMRAVSSTQPFLGFSALAPPSASPLPTQAVNADRLASAAATLPRQQQLPRRGRRRTRGPAVSGPVLGRLASNSLRPRIDDCLVELNPSTIRVLVKVYPPIVSLFGHVLH